MRFNLRHSFPLLTTKVFHVSLSLSLSLTLARAHTQLLGASVPFDIYNFCFTILGFVIHFSYVAFINWHALFLHREYFGEVLLKNSFGLSVAQQMPR